jgi:hypothetical protein
MSRTTQRKGDIGVTHAIALFTKLGWDVSLPITESASYDLIIDIPDVGLKRVQVRYVTGKVVDLRRIHSNSKGYVIKKPKENVYDWLFAVYYNNGKYQEHLITKSLSGRSAVNLNESNLFKEDSAVDEAKHS